MRRNYHWPVIRRRKQTSANNLDELVGETSELIGKLLNELKTLRAQNVALQREVERLSAGWDDIKRLARSAPRRKRAGTRTRAR